MSKVYPQGTRRDCCKSFSFVSKQFLRAFDTARKLSQTPDAERCGGKVSGLYLSVGFRLGIVGVLYGQSSLQKPRLCGIMEAQTSREVSYHGEVRNSDCGNKMRGSSRAQRVAPDVS